MSDLRVPVSSLSEGRLLLEPDSARYVAKVHRKKVGDRVVLFDPVAGLQATASIVDDCLANVWLEVDAVAQAPKHNLYLRLIQALGKGDKPEQAVRDATALGAQELVLVTAERSIARVLTETKMSRLKRIAEQVARQCGRGDLPVIRGPVLLDEIFSESANVVSGASTVKLICTWHEKAQPLFQAVNNVEWSRDQLLVLIGPEGGFSPHEVEAALMADFAPVTLGPYVLRTETACSVVLGALRQIADAAPSPRT